MLRRGIESADGKATVLSLAPITDTAPLLSLGPRSARTGSRSIVAMGGAAAVPGNIGAGHERSEWNLWIDPVAAREVLGSGTPITLVGLDATNDVPATVYLWDVLDRHHAGARAAAGPGAHRLERHVRRRPVTSGTRSPRRRWSAPTCSRSPASA